MNNSNFVQIQVKRDPANPTRSVVLAKGESAVLPDTTPTGRQILNAAQCSPTVDYVLLQLLPGRSLEEVSPEEVAELDAAETSFYAFRADRLFYFVLNENKYPWGQALPEGILRLLANVPTHAQVWMERQDEADVLIAPGQSVNLTGEGVERFYTKQPTWKLDVQGIEISSPAPTITVRHALELADINPDLPWTLVLKVQGRPKEQVEFTTVIDLTTPGIERLRVMPKVINNGEGPGLRRQFFLLEKDEKFLDAARYRWEAALDGERRWLLLHDYPLPSGYQQSHISLAIEIPALYPSAELDMFYCAPSVALQAGTAIPQADVQQVIFGQTFQRWSRHRENSVWSPADDSVITHLGLVEESFLREVAK
ncbi:multiubiquitin domain-containing protein [Massilia sp. LC238]|uniref:multiubiquitin domain-containing protein n=1 Tax=Massilia sp. LC238 TaxID=1502852 RepID=UPI0004E2E12D|nr:multiubiquitin domain-containing protein [Massilia sp. LC238]KFC66601.1 hypothetical protein FG94_03271 [Massilia sp. LC238]